MPNKPLVRAIGSPTAIRSPSRLIAQSRGLQPGASDNRLAMFTERDVPGMNVLCDGILRADDVANHVSALPPESATTATPAAMGDVTGYGQSGGVTARHGEWFHFLVA